MVKACVPYENACSAGKEWYIMRVTMVLGNDFIQPYLDDRVFREAAALRSEGWEVCVVCWARSITNKSFDHLPPVSEYKGIQVNRIYQNISPVKSLLIRRIAQHLRAMRKMAKKVKETKPDVIHYNDFNTLFSVVFGGKKGNTKVLYDSHEDYSLMIVSAVPRFLAKIASRFERWIVKKHVDAVISVSKPILDRLSKLGGEKNALILNCKDLKSYDVPDKDIKSTRKKFIQSLDDKSASNGNEKPERAEDMDYKFLLLYVGSLGENRGLREVLSVFSSLNSAENARLIIGGYGAIAGDLSNEMKDMGTALFLGEVPNDEVAVYTKACDAVYMMMNPKEKWHKIAMPNKLFEAMAAGRPIIASANTLYGEVVRNKECGIVIDYGDTDALKEAIIKLAADSESRTKMGQNGLHAAKREYNWESQKKKLTALYKTLVDDQKTPSEGGKHAQ